MHPELQSEALVSFEKASPDHDPRARGFIDTQAVELQNLPGSGDTIIEKLEELTDADFALDT